MLKTIKKQRGQTYSREDIAAIRQQRTLKRNGKASRVLAQLSQQSGYNQSGDYSQGMTQ